MIWQRGQTNILHLAIIHPAACIVVSINKPGLKTQTQHMLGDPRAPRDLHTYIWSFTLPKPSFSTTSVQTCGAWNTEDMLTRRHARRGLNCWCWTTYLWSNPQRQQSNDLSGKRWRNQPGLAAKKRSAWNNTWKSRSISAAQSESKQRGGRYTSEQTSGAPSLLLFILKSCVATISPPWTSQNKGEADDLYFSPSSALDLSVPPLFFFAILSYLTLPTLHRFYSGGSHKHDSRLFLDADAAVETLPNPPEWTEDENIRTAEVKPTHFRNFLLCTMDAGRPDNSAAHNRAGQNTSSDAQREPGLERNTFYTLARS